MFNKEQEKNKDDSSNIVGKVFFDKYTVIQKIGEGSFGKIFLGKDIKTNDKFAIKFESKKESANLLKKEAYTMLELKHPNLPKVYSYGTTNDQNILVMELLGDSLETCFNRCGKKLSVKTACMIGIEMINLCSFIHSKGYLHRDIKPDNYMFGREKKMKKLYMIDFGLSKKYLDDNKRHLPIQHGKKLVGTARYASINTHKGTEQGRRDDLESIGYILIYLIKGILPWQGLHVKQGEDHYQKIAQKKQEVKLSELCDGLPKQFAAYLDSVRKLKYEETPKYDYLISLLKIVLENEYKMTTITYDYDWIGLNVKETSKKENQNNEIQNDDENANSKLNHNSTILSMIMQNNNTGGNGSQNQNNKNSMKVSKNSANSNNHDEGVKNQNFDDDKDKIFELDADSFDGENNEKSNVNTSRVINGNLEKSLKKQKAKKTENHNQKDNSDDESESEVEEEDETEEKSKKKNDSKDKEEKDKNANDKKLKELKEKERNNKNKKDNVCCIIF